MVTHVYDFFELSLSFDGNKNNRDEDDETLKHGSEATADSDDETNDRPLPSQTTASPDHPLTKKLEEQAALFASKEQSIPIISDNRTNKKEKEKGSSANAFLPKSMNLTARCSSSSNPLLSNGKRRYVGSHFNTKLSNMSNLFREVKVPRQKSNKRAAVVSQPNKTRLPSQHMQQHLQHPYPRSALSSTSSQLRKHNHVDFMPKPTTFKPARSTHFSMGQQQLQQQHEHSKSQGFLTQPSFGNASSLSSHRRESLVQETPRRTCRKRNSSGSAHDDDDATLCMTPNNNNNDLSPVAPPHRHAAHVAAEAAFAASKRRR